jgi:hypothetical protein
MVFPLADKERSRQCCEGRPLRLTALLTSKRRAVRCECRRGDILTHDNSRKRQARTAAAKPLVRRRLGVDDSGIERSHACRNRQVAARTPIDRPRPSTRPQEMRLPRRGLRDESRTRRGHRVACPAYRLGYRGQASRLREQSTRPHRPSRSVPRMPGPAGQLPLNAVSSAGTVDSRVGEVGSAGEEIRLLGVRRLGSCQVSETCGHHYSSQRGHDQRTARCLSRTCVIPCHERIGCDAQRRKEVPGCW